MTFIQVDSVAELCCLNSNQAPAAFKANVICGCRSLQWSHAGDTNMCRCTKQGSAVKGLH